MGWARRRNGVGGIPQPYRLPAQYPRGKYLLAFNPLDGSSDIDVNLSVGSIFSILRAPNPGTDPKPEDYLQPGCKQVCAGYAIYGPSTILVLSVGTGRPGAPILIGTLRQANHVVLQPYRPPNTDGQPRTCHTHISCFHA